MKVEKKRIFISNLPDTATEEEIKKIFTEYGEIESVEIKERKELGPKNSSLFFAYVNIETDSKTLRKCFKDFSDQKWFGRYIMLQLARESFLDRLKRERNENPCDVNTQITQNHVKQNCIKKNVEKVSATCKSEMNIMKEKISPDSEVLDIVIKNNKKRILDGGLKIESVGKDPIMKIENSKRKTEPNTSEANLKRLEMIKKFKKDYQTQKVLIQQALSVVDAKPKNKIVFKDNFEAEELKDKKKLLFENESDGEEEVDFNVKEQFEGTEGQKLLQLQSKYKNDKRFVLDSRFLENKTDEGTTLKNDEEMTWEEEKRKEYEILTKVLGKRIVPKFEQKTEASTQRKSMLRFDPSEPNHSKFEKKRELVKKDKKTKTQLDLVDKKVDEKDSPQVSKAVFYKVTEDLKDTLQERKEFSLLSAFGKIQVKEEEAEEEQPSTGVTTTSSVHDQNPFKYDSSDDEDETGDIPGQEDAEQHRKNEFSTRKNIWVEPFFFTKDDYRLQEGFDFVERIKSDNIAEFTKLRRDLKEIVKAKVRNNQRKKKPFKKKLGGSKRRKMIRMKKALKK